MLDALLREYESSTEPSEGGHRYKSLDFMELYEILPDAFVVRPSMRRSEAIGVFCKALRECRRAGTMNSDAIIEHATAILKKARAVPREQYTLWTKFRASDMPQDQECQLVWRGVKFIASANLAHWLRCNEYFLNGVGRIDPDKPYSYGHAVLTCDDRNEDFAVDRMTDALQLFYGLINLYETWGRYSHRSGRNWTDGGLWLGPNLFLFHEQEFRGEDRIWYNPDFDEDAWEQHPPRMSRILDVIPRVSEALEVLDKHPLCDVLVRALKLMQNGFASRESNYRLLRYWSALEQLYGETDAKSRSNGEILKRAVFAEIDPDLSKWKLEHIARLRNDYVHAGGSGYDLHNMSQFLREFLARHINHWIFRGQHFTDHAALLQLVKLPSDRAALLQTREMIDRRLGV